MNDREEMVLVWTGLNLLQAKMMEEALSESGIECFLPAENDNMDLLGARTDYGLWVHKKDEKPARQLLEKIEAEMSDALDTADEEEDDVQEG